MGQEYASCLNALDFTVTRVTCHILIVVDRQGMLRDTDVGAWVRYWLHCGESGMSASCCVQLKVDCPFGRGFEEVEYKKKLSKPVRHFDRPPLPKLGLSLVVLHHPF